MFQCLGLGSVETGGCGEDWWHPECLIGLPRDWNKSETAKKDTTGDDEKEKQPDTANGDDEEEEEMPLPPGFPAEDDFETFLCFKCVDSNPWLKQYVGTTGFLPPVHKNGGLASPSDEKPSSETMPSNTEDQPVSAKKRKADSDTEDEPSAKRNKQENTETNTSQANPPEAANSESTKPKHASLPSTPSISSSPFSLFLKEDFRSHFCRCPQCYPNLASHPQLREEEETYEPPISEDGEANGGGSAGTKSLLDRGEAAFSNMDRVRAIEGAMVYNQLKDNLKEFLKPYAETGKAVSAEDIKGYFEKLRGDDSAIRDAAAGQASAAREDGSGSGGGEGDNRREQGGM